MTKIVSLFVKTGPLQGHKYFVKTDSPILIGRSEEANVRIAYDEFCSRKHARVFWENGACFIEDLKSTNGTFLNDNRIEGKAGLNNHDVIKLGDTAIVVSIADGPSEKKNDLDEVSYED